MTTAFTLRAALSESFYKNVLQQVANRMTERHLMKYLDWNGIKLGMFLLLWASGPFSAFSQRKRPFPLKWVTPSSVMWGSTKTYICVDVLSGALGKMTTCFSFFTRSDGFSPRFCWDTGGGLLPSQWPFVALPVMCDPVFLFFLFHLFTFITVFHLDSLEGPSGEVGRRHLRVAVVFLHRRSSFLLPLVTADQLVRRQRLSFPKQQRLEFNMVSWKRKILLPPANNYFSSGN